MPGSGKTRLLAELIGSAAAEGVLCLIGHCVDLGDTPPPYLPFTEAFTRLAAERPELVDELLARVPGPRPGCCPAAAPSRGEERVERGELFDSVLAALTSLAAEQPVLFIVEDVHWADQATRDLLGFLFTRLRDEPRRSIVASYRSDDLHRRHPLRRTLAQWSRLPVVDARATSTRSPPTTSARSSARCTPARSPRPTSTASSAGPTATRSSPRSWWPRPSSTATARSCRGSSPTCCWSGSTGSPTTPARSSGSRRSAGGGSRTSMLDAVADLHDRAARRRAARARSTPTSCS